MPPISKDRARFRIGDRVYIIRSPRLSHGSYNVVAVKLDKGTYLYQLADEAAGGRLYKDGEWFNQEKLEFESGGHGFEDESMTEIPPDLQVAEKPVRTLPEAVATRDIGVLSEFLSKYDAQDRVAASRLINYLRKLGVSTRGISAVLLEDDSLLSETEFPIHTDRPYPCVIVANMLADRFSRTEDPADLDDVGLIMDTARIERAELLLIRSAHASDGKDWSKHIFQWEIPAVLLDSEQCKSKDRNIMNDLSSFFVIVGSDGFFEASTCGQYIKQQFGEPGNYTMQMVTSALEYFISIDASGTGTYQIPDPPPNTPIWIERASSAYITVRAQNSVSGSSCIKAINWICEAIRVIPQSLKGPRIFKSQCRRAVEVGTGIKPAAMVQHLYDLEEMRQHEIGHANCWVRLFKCAVVVWATLPDKWAQGLQLSYEMLVRVSAVERYNWIQDQPRSDSTSEPDLTTSGGWIATGFFTALVPVRYDYRHNRIQWHLEVKKETESVIVPEDLGILKQNWEKLPDYEVFSQSKCFLGWKGDVNVLLGTSRGQYNIGWTNMTQQKTEKRWETGQVSIDIGTSNLLPITLKVGIAVTFKNNSTLLEYPIENTYGMAIAASANHVAFVYDDGSKIAWLVPELSWILHLCHVWHRHHQKSGTQDSDYPIPFAEVSNDGYRAAFEALKDRGEDKVRSDLTLREVLLVVYQNMAKSPKTHTGKRISGYEAMSIIQKPRSATSPRELKLHNEIPAWSYLIKRADSKRFCIGLGQALEPRNKDPDGDCRCDLIPKDQQLLVAHNSCLDIMLQTDNTPLHDFREGVLKLRDGFFWVMYKWPFDICTHICSDDFWMTQPDVLQSFSRTTARTAKGPFRIPPVEGASVFGAHQPNKLRKSPPDSMGHS